MGTWNKDELAKISSTDDLHISPLREDGKTYGTPTWIWSVVVDGNLYVRPYNGHGSRWYEAAMRQGAGRITAAGLSREVSFTDAANLPQEAIDAAYRKKYSGSPYLAPMISDRARSATVLIQPRLGRKSARCKSIAQEANHQEKGRPSISPARLE